MNNIDSIEYSDSIENSIEIAAPVSRVWRALTDHREFGAWFGAELEGPFVPGELSLGWITGCGHGRVRWEVTVREMVPEERFSFEWHPYAIDPEVDFSQEPTTLVVFRLEPTATGTLLTVTESGFDAIPKDRRFEAFRMNSRGWTAQIDNIGRYVAGGG